MLENSRKRARKSKLEVREGVELEEATVLYMEAIETKVKEEPMIDVGPTTLIGTKKQIVEPFNDVALPEADNKPMMEFCVKIEVEECDETGPKGSPNLWDNVAKKNKQYKNELKVTLKKENNCVLNDIKPTTSKVEETTTVEVETALNDEIKNEFKEYCTNRPMILKITDRLLKSVHAADKLLAIAVRNYAGRVLDEPVKDPRDMLLYRALGEWQSWYQEDLNLRDVPLVYKCYICGKSWWYLHDFREHIAQHLKLNNFEVSLETNNDECSLICFQLDIVYYDVEPPETNCDRCGKAADSHTFMDNDSYNCSGCEMKFSTCTQLQLHEATCTHRKLFFPLDSEIHKCSICELECVESNLNEHMIRKHTVRSDVITTWDVKKCNICTRTYIIMPLHVCIRKTNNYGCNFCGQSFQKKIYKEIHMENYNKSTACRVCGKQLTTRCMEFSHMLQHTDRYALMYKCIQCIEGSYYPDEFSIVHHTKVVHNRPFEKKFKYLEMVILPKQCLEKSSKTSQFEKAAANIICQDGGKGDIASSNVFVPSTKFQTTHKRPEVPIDVVVKQEPVHHDVDSDTLRVSGLPGIKTEAVDDTAPHLKISDITSLQDFIKFKTEPVEEVVAEDLIIVEDKSETITLCSSDDSEDDFKLKNKGRKKKKLMKVVCVCGYVDTRNRIKAHKLGCTVTKANSQVSDVVDKTYTSNSNNEIDEMSVHEEVDVEESSDDGWGQGVPLENNSTKGGLKYTCHCKKVFVGTLAAFKRHKKACIVVAKLKKQRKVARLPTVYACTKCSSSFKSMVRYAKHFSRVHHYQKLRCPQCLVLCDGLSKLGTHVTSHVNRNYLKIRIINLDQGWSGCNKCKMCQTPVDKKEYFKHWESHLELRPKEDVVENDSDSLPDDDVGDALVIDTAPPEETQSVYGPELMQKALLWLQSPDGVDTIDEKTCVFCARRFTRKNDSKRHVIEHLLQDAYSRRAHYRALRCQICALGFPKEDKFKHHMREHASLPVYQCNLCGKSFSDSSNFCKHRKVHGLSLMVCTICEKKFQNHNHLARHMEMHEKTKPIVCDACGKISYTQSAHKKHVRCAHERHRTRVLCPVCREGFTRLKDKWDHMWLVHKERKFNADCPVCPKAFRRFADVKSHVREVHKRNVRLSADRRLVVYA